MTVEQAAFGSGLRRQRERREISLAAVAASTKIQQSLLASLERGDATHWPAGIYRRAFLREYASAVGLPPEPIVADFLRLFPEAGDPRSDCLIIPDAAAGLRLTLARERRWRAAEVAARAGAALLDAAAVLAIGAALGKLFGVMLWTAAALFAVAYYSAATSALGRSPMLWLLNAAGLRLRRADRAKARVTARPSSRDLLHIVSTTPRQPQVPADHDFTHAVEGARSASR